MIDRKSFVPIYQQLAIILKEQINSGQIKPGEKLPSESEMIEYYRIGRLTVREALTQLVNENYVEKIQGKGTYCKQPPIKTNTINVDVMLDMSDTYFIPYYIKSISEALSNNNANFIISDTKDSDTEICTMIDRVINKGSAGVILQPSHGLEYNLPIIQEAFNRLRHAGIPYVMIDSVYENINASYLILDERLGGMLAYDFLNSLNHKNIAVVYSRKYKDSMLRLNGFVDRMRSEDKYNSQSITLIEINDQLEDNLEKTLAIDKAPTALFCYNDETALRCLKKLNIMDIKVPEQISVLGFDDSLIASNSTPALTTIAHPKEIMGEFAVKGLFDLINGKIIWPYVKVFEPALVVRDSCKKIE